MNQNMSNRDIGLLGLGAEIGTAVYLYLLGQDVVAIVVSAASVAAVVSLAFVLWRSVARRHKGADSPR